MIQSADRGRSALPYEVGKVEACLRSFPSGRELGRPSLLRSADALLRRLEDGRPYRCCGLEVKSPDAHSREDKCCKTLSNNIMHIISVGLLILMCCRQVISTIFA